MVQELSPHRWKIGRRKHLPAAYYSSKQQMVDLWQMHGSEEIREGLGKAVRRKERESPMWKDNREARGKAVRRIERESAMWE